MNIINDPKEKENFGMFHEKKLQKANQKEFRRSEC